MSTEHRAPRHKLLPRLQQSIRLLHLIPDFRQQLNVFGCGYRWVLFIFGISAQDIDRFYHQEYGHRNDQKIDAGFQKDSVFDHNSFANDLTAALRSASRITILRSEISEPLVR